MKQFVERTRHRQEKEMEPLPHTTYKNGLKIDQKPKTTKVLEENINLPDLGLGNSFLNKTPKVQETKQKNWTSSKLKTFVLQRTVTSKMVKVSE